MQLPGQTRLGVQSLGRQDSSLEMRVAQSKVDRTSAVVNTVAGVNDAVQKSIVEPAYQREAVAQYAKAESSRADILTRAESAVNNPTGMVPIEEIPTWVDYREFDDDGDGNITRREMVPTHEVAGEWYLGEMKRSQKAVMSEMTNAQAMRKMKNDFGSAYLNNYAGVLLQAQKNKQEAELADMDMAVERFVEGGDQGKAETLLLGGMKTGVIGPKEGAERLMAVPGDIDSYRTSRRIHTSGLTEMDDILDHIYRDYDVDAAGEIMVDEDGNLMQNPMSFAQRKTLVGELESRRKSLTATGSTAKDEASAEQLNADLIELQNLDDPLDEAQLTEKGYALSNTDHKTLIVANRALHATKADRTDPRTLAEFQMAVNDLATPDPDHTIQARRGALMNQINLALDADDLTADDAWKLIERINTTEERALATPDMDMAVDQIYKILTRGSKNALGLNTSALEAQNAADAELALYDAARAAGPAFNARKWLDDNMALFASKQANKNRDKMLKSRVKAHYVRDADGMTLFQESYDNIKKMRAAGELDYKAATKQMDQLNEQMHDERVQKALEAENAKGQGFWSIFD